MSKTTLAIIAGVSAASGAAVTAALYSSRSPSSSSKPTTTSSIPSIASQTSTAAPPTSLPGATNPLSRSAALSPVDPAGLFQYGFPGPKADLRSTVATVSAYDRERSNPHWVAEHITAASLAHKNGDRRHSVFVEDEAIPAMYRAKLADYYRSGYDRGHQVPAADAKWSQEAMNSTFLLSNMCPQVGDGFNRDYWAHFEDFCRRLTNRFPSVRIVTGPLYLPKKGADGKWRVSYEMVGSPPNVAVPTHFYKVIFAEDGRTGGNVSVGAFVLPNAPISNDKPLSDFEVPIEAIERASGLEFASKLPQQRRRKLCADISCSIFVRDYMERQKNLKGEPPAGPGLPTPK